MKNNKFNRYITAFFLVVVAACNPDEILDKDPLDRFSDAAVFSDINLAKAYLADAYDGTDVGWEEVMLSGITDESYYWSSQINAVYVEGNISPDMLNPFAGGPDLQRIASWTDHYRNIQIINVFLDNIARLKEANPEQEDEVDVLHGEALFLRAYGYTQLARMYGGVVLASEPFGLGQDITEFKRSSFEETVDFIVKDTDAAAELLKSDAETEMGRASKGAALALKSRILTFAASDLTADGTAANEYVGYENPDRQALWTAARDAAKAVIDLGEYSLEDFGAPDKNAVSEKYHSFFAHNQTLASPELIWGRMYTMDAGTQPRIIQIFSPPQWAGWGLYNPTQKIVDSYQMEDGSDFFEHFSVDPDGTYINISGKYTDENPYNSRDPRFYGSLLYDGAVFKPRHRETDLVYDQVGIFDFRSRYEVGTDGEKTLLRHGLDTQRMGRGENTRTGYQWKKFLPLTIEIGQPYESPVWIEFRYTEILLNYAEALIELGQGNIAAEYINMIRNRSAMPDFTGDVEEALRYERMIEMPLENIRWYDIRRWKIMDEAMVSVKGISIEEVRYPDGETVTTWKQVSNPGPRTNRAGTTDPSKLDKMYWLPIPTSEMNKAPQLIQNPNHL